METAFIVIGALFMAVGFGCVTTLGVAAWWLSNHLGKMRAEWRTQWADGQAAHAAKLQELAERLHQIEAKAEEFSQYVAREQWNQQYGDNGMADRIEIPSMTG